MASVLPTFASEHLDSFLGALKEMIPRPEDAYPSRIVSLGTSCRRFQLWLIVSSVESFYIWIGGVPSQSKRKTCSQSVPWFTRATS